MKNTAELIEKEKEFINRYINIISDYNDFFQRIFLTKAINASNQKEKMTINPLIYKVFTDAYALQCTIEEYLKHYDHNNLDHNDQKLAN